MKKKHKKLIFKTIPTAIQVIIVVMAVIVPMDAAVSIALILLAIWIRLQMIWK